MIGIQVITHGKMASGILDTVDMVLGNLENIAVNELKREQDIETFRREVLETTNQLTSSDGVLIFVDMFGASPYNTSFINSREVNTDNYKIIAGVNLPLLMEAISNRSSMDINQLYTHLLGMREQSIIGWEK